MTDIYQAPEATLTKPTKVGEYGSIESALAGDYEISYGTIFSEAWQKVKGAKLSVFLAFWVYYIIFIAAYAAIAFVVYTIFSAAGLPPSNMIIAAFYGVDIQSLSTWGNLLGTVVETSLIALAVGPLGAGFFVMGIKRSIGKDISVGNLFSQYSKLIPIALTTILLYILIYVGFLLLIIPGIYLVVAYSMAIPLVIDKGMSPWQALETSRKAITKKWFKVTGLLLVITIIFTISMFLIIAPIWSFPFVMIAWGILYRNMFGVEDRTITI